MELGAGGEDPSRPWRHGGLWDRNDAEKERPMNVQPRGMLRGRSGSDWLSTARHLVSALLLFAVPVGVAALTVSLAGGPMSGPGIVKVGQIALLLLSPVLLFAVTYWAV